MNPARPDAAPPPTPGPSVLRKALADCRSLFLSAGFFSFFINLLVLVPTAYMMQVYDRVLASNSESTLVMLTLITLFLFVVMGALEWVRSQILIVAGTRLDRLLGARTFDSVFRQTLASGGRVATAQALGDLLQVRQFVSGPGPLAFFDAPWLPLYITVMFAFHPWYGVCALASALVLLGLAVWNEVGTRGDLQEANRHSMAASNQTQRNLRNAEVIEAMGMLPRMRARWQAQQDTVLTLQARASRKGGLISALSKTFRMAIQSLVLGLGAYLAIRREISAGVVIAGSVLLGRALAPLDILINSWRQFLAARDAYQRLDGVLRGLPTTRRPLPLPAPMGLLAVDKLVVTPPGAPGPVIKGVSLQAHPGEVLAVIGASGAGKSTLVRALLGLHAPSSGTVRLDGAELAHWDRESLGHHVGYLPQDVELLDGSVSENIARFGAVDAQKVIAAAEAAGVHAMILRLPQAYDTALVGNVLSAGQRQRIGLARALYGNPRLLVLDEPNSNLDQEGDAALSATLARLRADGRTVIVVTHRHNLLAQVDKILMLADGQVAVYSDRDKVFATLRQAAAPAQPPSAPQPPAIA